jgi:hypothetical protein
MIITGMERDSHAAHVHSSQADKVADYGNRMPRSGAGRRISGSLLRAGRHLSDETGRSVVLDPTQV